MGRRGRHRNEPPRDGIPEALSGTGDDPEDGTAPRAGGRAERRRAARRVKRRRRLRATREIPLLIGIALGIALLIKTFLVQAFVIPSGSMEPTIQINDRVLVDKFTPWFGWEPERGEVVVFKDPGGWLEQDTGAAPSEDPVGIRQLKTAMTWVGLMPKEDEDLIKRVIAIGGDTVACCSEDGRITVNGTPVDEPYVHPGNDPSLIEFEVTVPAGRIFVMGDHRERSADSRYHLSGPDEGTIPVEQVVGRAVVIAWPYDHWSRLNGSDAFAVVEEP